MSGAPFQLGGAAEGPLAVYVHGAPGGAQEAARFDAEAARCGVRLAAVERAHVAPGLDGEAYWRALAAAVDDLASDGSVTLIGFSVGAFVALQISVRLRVAASSVCLVSPAGPLESGPFLAQMAGAPVFRLAQGRRGVFAGVVAAQGLLVRLAPGAVLRMLFAGSAQAEAALAADPAFRAWLIGLLRRSYGADRAGFVRDLQLYVRPWADSLAGVRGPVRIWQGEADTWTPPAMAERLAQLLPAGATLERRPGLGHFTTLFDAMPEILRRTGGARP